MFAPKLFESKLEGRCTFHSFEILYYLQPFRQSNVDYVVVYLIRSRRRHGCSRSGHFSVQRRALVGKNVSFAKSV